MATLPHRKGGEGDSRGGVRLPSIEQIPDVAIQRDPGLNVPRGIFGEQEGAALANQGTALREYGREAMNIGNQLQNVRLKVEAANKKLRDNSELNRAILQLMDYETQVDQELASSTDVQAQTIRDDYRKTVEKLSGGINDPIVRQQFTTEAAKSMIQTNARAMKREYDILYNDNQAFGERIKQDTLKTFSTNPEMLRDPRQRITADNAVKSYYQETMGKELGMSQTDIDKNINGYLKDASNIEFNQDRSAVINSGNIDHLEGMINRLENGDYMGIDPTDVPAKKDALVRDYVNIREREEKRLTKELESNQKKNYIDAYTRIPGKNLTFDQTGRVDTGQSKPDLTFDELNAGIKNGAYRPEDAENLIKALQSAKAEEVKESEKSDSNVKTILEDAIIFGNGTHEDRVSAIYNSNATKNEYGESLLSNDDMISLLEKEQRYFKAEQSDEGSKTNREIREMNRFIKSRTLITFGPLGSFARTDEQQQYQDLSSLAEARIRAGENPMTVREDIQNRLTEFGTLQFSPETIQRAEQIVASGDKLNPEYDVARKRLFVARQQTMRAIGLQQALKSKQAADKAAAQKEVK